MKEKVSVILPVFNAEKFLHKAVDSVLMQEQVSELILVEDGSKDGSPAICMEVQKKHPDRVKVLFHRNHTNKGAAASRNLGILNAQNDILGFLDADDFYLPGRFNHALNIFQQHSDADGVYEAIGTHYYDEEGKELHLKRMNELKIDGLSDHLTTLTHSVAPEKLFEDLIMGNKGWFHFNGLTLRKSAILKTGLLDKFLWYGQDIDFFLRLSIYSRLYAGNLQEPVAMRGVYHSNSTLSVYTNQERLFMNQRCSAYRWRKMFMIMLQNDFPLKINRFLFNRFVDNFDDKIINMPLGFKRKMRKFYTILMVLYRYKWSYRKVVG